MHCMLSDNDKESNTAKGVNIVMGLKQYEDTLLNKKIIRHKMKRIQSKKHKIDTFVLDDGIKMLVYFHKDSKKQKDVLKDSQRLS